MSSIHVLIIEDDKDQAWTLKYILENRPEVNYTTESAQTLMSALLRLDRGGVDVILLDLGLPDASGLDVVRRVRAMARTVRIIVLTGWSASDLAAPAKEAGADDFLQKPVDPAELSVRLQSQVIYRASEKEKHEIEKTLTQLGQVAEVVKGAMP